MTREINVFDRFRFKRERCDDDDDEEEEEEKVLQGKRIKTEPESESVAEQAASKSLSRSQQKKNKSSNAVEEVGAVDDDLSVKKWQERWHSICDECFEARVKCVHHPEQRLRLLLVGHNPSLHAWTSGFSYSNPSNRMWSLLTGTFSTPFWDAILPADAQIGQQNQMPHVVGVGFTSIGLEPGNDAAKYAKDTMSRWRDDFFRRLRDHRQRLCARHCDATAHKGKCSKHHGPVVIAFAGKRQFSWMFTPPLQKIEQYGQQTRWPSGWPLKRDESELWVLPSSSGRAVMTKEQRALPYQQLAQRLQEIPWPLLD